MACQTIQWTTYVPPRPFRPGACYGPDGYPSAPPNESAEDGYAVLPQGVTFLVIPFATPKYFAYAFDRLYVENLVDPEPYVVSPIVRQMNMTSFRVDWNTLVDTSNYVLRWKVSRV